MLVLQHPESFADAIQETFQLAHVDLLHFFEQGERRAELVADGDEGGDVLREAGATVAKAGVEEGAADALVRANAVRHFQHVRASGFANLRQGVDVADLQGQEAVRGVLDELGAVDVRHEHGSHERLIHLLHDGQGAVAVAADDDAVRLHQVLHGAAFAKELRIAHHIKLHTRAGVAADGLRHTLAGLYRHGALVHHHAVAVEEAGDLAGHLLHKAQVHAAVWLGRGGHGDEQHLAMVHAFFRAGGETQALGGHVLADHGLQARFINRNAASLQGLDLFFIVVHADNLVACFSETGACGEPDVAGADDGKFHEMRG